VVMLRLVAEHADVWNGGGPPELAAHLNQALDEWCRKVGRDPREIERTAILFPDLVPRWQEYVNRLPAPDRGRGSAVRSQAFQAARCGARGGSVAAGRRLSVPRAIAFSCRPVREAPTAVMLAQGRLDRSAHSTFT
jgi:hypothetical protein